MEIVDLSIDDEEIQIQDAELLRKKVTALQKYIPFLNYLSNLDAVANAKFTSIIVWIKKKINSLSVQHWEIQFCESTIIEKYRCLKNSTIVPFYISEIFEGSEISIVISDDDDDEPLETSSSLLKEQDISTKPSKELVVNTISADVEHSSSTCSKNLQTLIDITIKNEILKVPNRKSSAMGNQETPSSSLSSSQTKRRKNSHKKEKHFSKEKNNANTDANDFSIMSLEEHKKEEEKTNPNTNLEITDKSYESYENLIEERAKLREILRADDANSMTLDSKLFQRRDSAFHEERASTSSNQRRDSNRCNQRTDTTRCNQRSKSMHCDKQTDSSRWNYRTNSTRCDQKKKSKQCDQRRALSRCDPRDASQIDLMRFEQRQKTTRYDQKRESRYHERNDSARCKQRNKSTGCDQITDSSRSDKRRDSRYHQRRDSTRFYQRKKSTECDQNRDLSRCDQRRDSRYHQRRDSNRSHHSRGSSRCDQGRDSSSRYSQTKDSTRSDTAASYINPDVLCSLTKTLKTNPEITAKVIIDDNLGTKIVYDYKNVTKQPPRKMYNISDIDSIILNNLNAMSHQSSKEPEMNNKCTYTKSSSTDAYRKAMQENAVSQQSSKELETNNNCTYIQSNSTDAYRKAMQEMNDHLEHHDVQRPFLNQEKQKNSEQSSPNKMILGYALPNSLTNSKDSYTPEKKSNQSMDSPPKNQMNNQKSIANCTKLRPLNRIDTMVQPKAPISPQLKENLPSLDEHLNKNKDKSTNTISIQSFGIKENNSEISSKKNYSLDLIEVSSSESNFSDDAETVIMSFPGRRISDARLSSWSSLEDNIESEAPSEKNKDTTTDKSGTFSKLSSKPIKIPLKKFNDSKLKNDSSGKIESVSLPGKTNSTENSKSLSEAPSSLTKNIFRNSKDSKPMPHSSEKVQPVDLSDKDLKIRPQSFEMIPVVRLRALSKSKSTEQLYTLTESSDSKTSLHSYEKVQSVDVTTKDSRPKQSSTEKLSINLPVTIKNTEKSVSLELPFSSRLDRNLLSLNAECNTLEILTTPSPKHSSENKSIGLARTNKTTKHSKSFDESVLFMERPLKNSKSKQKHARTNKRKHSLDQDHHLYGKKKQLQSRHESNMENGKFVSNDCSSTDQEETTKNPLKRKSSMENTNDRPEKTSKIIIKPEKELIQTPTKSKSFATRELSNLTCTFKESLLPATIGRRRCSTNFFNSTKNNNQKINEFRNDKKDIAAPIQRRRKTCNEFHRIKLTIGRSDEREEYCVKTISDEKSSDESDNFEEDNKHNNEVALCSKDDTKCVNTDLKMMFLSTKICAICNTKSNDLTKHYVTKHNTESYISRISSDDLHKLQTDKCKYAPNSNKKKQYQITCVFCKEELEDNFENLRAHYSYHTGEYNFQCEGCKIIKPYPSDIGSHQKHTGMCRNSATLKIYHYDLNATNICLFVCKICNFSNLNKINLKKHLCNQHLLEYNEHEHVEKCILIAKDVAIEPRLVAEDEAPLSAEKDYLNELHVDIQNMVVKNRLANEEEVLKKDRNHFSKNCDTKKPSQNDETDLTPEELMEELHAADSLVDISKTINSSNQSPKSLFEELYTQDNLNENVPEMEEIIQNTQTLLEDLQNSENLSNIVPDTRSRNEEITSNRAFCEEQPDNSDSHVDIVNQRTEVSEEFEGNLHVSNESMQVNKSTEKLDQRSLNTNVSNKVLNHSPEKVLKEIHATKPLSTTIKATKRKLHRPMLIPKIEPLSEDELQQIELPMQYRNFNQHSSNGFGLLKCMIEKCFFSTNSDIEFRMHFVNNHNNSYENLDCPYCIQKSPCLKILISHVWLKHGMSNYQCAKCSYRSVVPGNVIIHRRAYHKDFEIAKAVYRCYKPMEKPTDKTDMLEKINKNVASLKCPDCPSSFYAMSTIKLHIQKAHPVTFQIFSSLNLNYFACIHCKIESNSKETMQIHMALHHPDEPCRVIVRKLVPEESEDSVNDLMLMDIHFEILKSDIETPAFKECKSLNIISYNHDELELEAVDKKNPPSTPTNIQSQTPTEFPRLPEVCDTEPINETTSDIDGLMTGIKDLPIRARTVCETLPNHQFSTSLQTNINEDSSNVQSNMEQSADVNKECSVVHSIMEPSPDVNEVSSVIHPTLEHSTEDVQIQSIEELSEETAEVSLETLPDIWNEEIAKEGQRIQILIELLVENTGVHCSTLYRCPVCVASFMHFELWLTHVKHKHNITTNVPCPYCLKQFELGLVDSHFQTHRRHQYICYYCIESFCSTEKIHEHFVSAHENNCEIIQKQVASFYVVMYQKDLISGSTGVYFAEAIHEAISKKLQRHTIKEWSEGLTDSSIEEMTITPHKFQDFKCLVALCPFVGSSEKSFDDHIKQHEVPIEFNCSYCKLCILELDWDSIKCHIMQHQSPILYICCVCKFVHHTTEGIAKHIENVHNSRDVPVLCLNRNNLDNKVSLSIFLPPNKMSFATTKICFCCAKEIPNNRKYHDHLKKEHRLSFLSKCQICDKIILTRFDAEAHCKTHGMQLFKLKYEILSTYLHNLTVTSILPLTIEIRLRKEKRAQQVVENECSSVVVKNEVNVKNELETDNQTQRISLKLVNTGQLMEKPSGQESNTFHEQTINSNNDVDPNAGQQFQSTTNHDVNHFSLNITTVNCSTLIETPLTDMTIQPQQILTSLSSMTMQIQPVETQTPFATRENLTQSEMISQSLSSAVSQLTVTEDAPLQAITLSTEPTYGEYCSTSQNSVNAQCSLPNTIHRNSPINEALTRAVSNNQAANNSTPPTSTLHSLLNSQPQKTTTEASIPNRHYQTFTDPQCSLPSTVIHYSAPQQAASFVPTRADNNSPEFSVIRYSAPLDYSFTSQPQQTIARETSLPNRRPLQRCTPPTVDPNRSSSAETPQEVLNEVELVTGGRAIISIPSTAFQASTAISPEIPQTPQKASQGTTNSNQVVSPSAQQQQTIPSTAGTHQISHIQSRSTNTSNRANVEPSTSVQQLQTNTSSSSYRNLKQFLIAETPLTSQRSHRISQGATESNQANHERPVGRPGGQQSQTYTSSSSYTSFQQSLTAETPRVLQSSSRISQGLTQSNQGNVRPVGRPSAGCQQLQTYTSSSTYTSFQQSLTAETPEMSQTSHRNSQSERPVGRSSARGQQLQATRSSYYTTHQIASTPLTSQIPQTSQQISVIANRTNLANDWQVVLPYAGVPQSHGFTSYLLPSCNEIVPFCGICFAECEDFYALQIHYETNHAPNHDRFYFFIGRKIRCMYCNFQCSLESLNQHHITYHHDKIRMSRSVVDQARCGYCHAANISHVVPVRACPNPHRVLADCLNPQNIKELKKFGSQYYSCDICRMSFQHKQQFDHHLASIHSQCNDPSLVSPNFELYSCPSCSFLSYNIMEVISHMRFTHFSTFSLPNESMFEYYKNIKIVYPNGLIVFLSDLRSTGTFNIQQFRELIQLVERQYQNLLRSQPMIC